jgi:hypothetical protein
MWKDVTYECRLVVRQNNSVKDWILVHGEFFVSSDNELYKTEGMRVFRRIK